MSYFYPESFNAATETVDVSFNVDDFKINYDYVMKGDLRFYASLVQPNVFLAHNYFQSILVTSINGLSDGVLSFLQGLSENVQESLSYLEMITANISYDVSSNVTKIESHTEMDTMSVNNAGADKMVCNTINCQKLITDTVIYNESVCDKIICKQIKAENSLPIGCYLFMSNGRNVPIAKSGALKTIIPSIIGSEFTCEITLMPGYRISFLNARNQMLYNLESNTSDILYSVSVSIDEIPYKINLYFDNNLI